MIVGSVAAGHSREGAVINRFYLPSSGTPSLSPANGGGWDYTTTGGARYPLNPSTATADTAQVAKQASESTSSQPVDTLIGQFVSPPLAAQTLLAPWSFTGCVLALGGSGSNAKLRWCWGFVNADGTVNTGGGAFASGSNTSTMNQSDYTTETLIGSYGVNVVIPDGSRFVFEIGWRGTNITSSLRWAQVQIGDVSTGGDLPYASGLIGNYPGRGWINMTTGLKLAAA